MARLLTTESQGALCVQLHCVDVSRKNSLLTTILGVSCPARKKRKVDDGLMLKAPNGPGHKDGLDGGPTFSKKLARLNAQCGWINSVANLLAILAFSHTTFR